MTLATFPRRRRTLAALVAVTGASLLLGAAPASAATYAVTKLADTRDGVCDLVDCSLRDAVEAASASPDADVITLPAGTYDLDRVDAGDPTGATDGDLRASGAIVVSGAGAGSTVVRWTRPGGAREGVFTASGAGTHLTLQDLTVTGGNQWGLGGGGVGVWDGADLTLRRTVVRGNSTDYNVGRAAGGGVRFDGGNLLVEDSAILDNTAGDWGGGLAVEAASGAASIVNTTLAGNVAYGTGGALSVNGGRPVALRHVTIIGNDGGSWGDGLGGNLSGVRIRSSIIGLGVGGGRTCDASLGSDGGTVVASAAATQCGLGAATGDLVADDLRLAATPVVAANGIPVLRPQAGSPAIGAVSAASCLATDAGGAARPAGAPCAAGAVEPLPGTPGPGAPDPGIPAPGDPAPGDPVPGVPEPGVPGGVDVGRGAPAPAGPTQVPGASVAPDTVAPVLVLPKRVAVNKARKRATLSIACPRTEVSCSAEVRLQRVRKVKRRRVTDTLARGTVTFAGGSARKLSLKLTRKGRAALAGRRTAKVTLKLTVRDAAGNTGVQQRTVTLRVAAR